MMGGYSMDGIIISKKLLDLKIAITDLCREILIENIQNGSLETDFEIVISLENETITLINRLTQDKQDFSKELIEDLLTLKYLIAYCLFIDMGLHGNNAMLHYVNQLDLKRPNQKPFYEVLDY